MASNRSNMTALMAMPSMVVGFLAGWTLSISAMGFAPTAVVWDGSACAAGLATVTTVATDPNGNTYSLVTPDVTFPVATFIQSYPNLPPTNYLVRAIVTYADATVQRSEVQSILGLGDAPVPVPSPSPTPTPTPSPTQTPQPPPGYKSVSGTEPDGTVWTLSADQSTLRNGVSFANGHGVMYLFIGTDVYVLDTGNVNWWHAVAGAWVLVGAQPTYTPVTPPAPTPTPSPTPVDLTPVLTALSQQSAMLGQISTALNSLVPHTVTCAITGMGSYSNGDQKLTVRCVPSGFATGQAIQIIK